MAKHKKHIDKISGFEEFEKYLSGSLSKSDQHEFEKKLMDDDFESEALEGFEKFKLQDVEGDISTLKRNLSASSQRNKQYPLVKMAAVVALFISLTVVLFYVIKPDTAPGLSQKESPSTSPEGIADDDSGQSSAISDHDSIFISQQYEPVAKDGTKRGGKPKAVVPPNAKAGSPASVQLEPVAEAYEELEEVITENYISERPDLSIQKLEPVKEGGIAPIAELEPIPETGDFKRVASSRVKPSEDPVLNERKGDLPTRFKYHEGMKDLPRSPEKENLSMTMAGKTFSKNVNAGYTNAEVSSADDADDRVLKKEAAATESKPAPKGGYDAYFDYVYNEIQSLTLPGNNLPPTIDIVLKISGEGRVKEVVFTTQVDDLYREKLQDIFLEGPVWENISGNAESQDQTVPLQLNFED